MAEQSEGGEEQAGLERDEGATNRALASGSGASMLAPEHGVS